MALWSWKALLRFSRCWLWKGTVRSRCSAGEQPVQQVAWKEQVRQKPRAAQQCGAAQARGWLPGWIGSLVERQVRDPSEAGGQVGGQPSGSGQHSGTHPTAGLQQWEHSSSRGQGQEADLVERVLAKGGQGLLLPSSLRAISCAVCRLASCPGSQIPPPAQENVLSTLRYWQK